MIGFGSSGSEHPTRHGKFPREWNTFKYRSARHFLVNIEPLRIELAIQGFDKKLRNLRSSGSKSERECWQASLFAHGIGTAVLGTQVSLAMVEEKDFDCVAMWARENSQFFAPVQIKEFVPKELNSEASLQAEIIKLTKYLDSGNLVVAIYLNRGFHLNLNSIWLPRLNIAELWMFGATSENGRQFMLWGNLLDNPDSFRFEYPN